MFLYFGFWSESCFFILDFGPDHVSLFWILVRVPQLLGLRAQFSLTVMMNSKGVNHCHVVIFLLSLILRRVSLVAFSCTTAAARKHFNFNSTFFSRTFERT